MNETDYLGHRLRMFSRQILSADRVKTVLKLFTLEPLGLASSEKQIPQAVENIRNVKN
jgi:hypothetical protein